MPAPMKSLAKWFGTRVTASIGRKSYDLVVFDFGKWRERRTFVMDVFGDCEVPGDYPDWLERKTPGGPTRWKHPTIVPFAMQDPMGNDDVIERPSQVDQFHVLWVTDVTRPGPVYIIDVDGSATPARRAPVLTKDLREVTFAAKRFERARKSAAPAFEEATLLSKLRTGMGPQSYDAWGLLDRLRGGKGESPKPPRNRDPRWADALRTEVLEAVHHGEGFDLIVATWLSFSTAPQAGAGALLVTLSQQLSKPGANAARDRSPREGGGLLAAGVVGRSADRLAAVVPSRPWERRRRSAPRARAPSQEERPRGHRPHHSPRGRAAVSDEWRPDFSGPLVCRTARP